MTKAWLLLLAVGMVVANRDPRLLVRAHVEASGGKEAFAEVDSLRMTARAVVASRPGESAITIWQARPGRILIDTVTAGQRTREGFDGRIGWIEEPGKPARRLKGNALEQLRRRADDFLSLSDPDAAFPDGLYLGEANFEGKPAIAAQVRTKRRQQITAYFDPVTSLQLGLITKVLTADGEVEVTMAASEYKQFGRVKIPTKLEQSAQGIRSTIVIDAFEANPKDMPRIAAPDGLTTPGGI